MSCLGDSARSIAPITSKGMYMALRSVNILAYQIDGYFSKIITKNELINNYNSFWSNEFSIRIKLSCQLQNTLC